MFLVFRCNMAHRSQINLTAKEMEARRPEGSRPTSPFHSDGKCQRSPRVITANVRRPCCMQQKSHHPLAFIPLVYVHGWMCVCIHMYVYV